MGKKETFIRSGFKTVTYRILHIVTIFFLSLAFTSSLGRASFMAGTVLVLGLAIYYGFERLSLLFPWGRIDGYDSRTRSIVKTVAYRIITFLMAFFGSKAILQFDNKEALIFFVLDQLIVLVIYFIVERVYNAINWGKLDVKEGV